MKWIERDGMHLSAPYRIYSSVRGHDCWLYGPKSNYILAKGMRSLEEAKRVCANHKIKADALVAKSTSSPQNSSKPVGLA